MPESFIHLPEDDRNDTLQTAAAQLGQQAAVLEKDVWVCWALQALFFMPNAHPMAFKGGTSLSKIFNAMHRFSEDVDITLDYRAFGEDFDPFQPGASKTAIKKFGQRLKEHVSDYTHNVILPYMCDKLAEQPTPEAFNIELSDDGENSGSTTLQLSYTLVTTLLDTGMLGIVPPRLNRFSVTKMENRHEFSFFSQATAGLLAEEPVVLLNARLHPVSTDWNSASIPDRRLNSMVTIITLSPPYDLASHYSACRCGLSITLLIINCMTVSHLKNRCQRTLLPIIRTCRVIR